MRTLLTIFWITCFLNFGAQMSNGEATDYVLPDDNLLPVQLDGDKILNYPEQFEGSGDEDSMDTSGTVDKVVDINLDKDINSIKNSSSNKPEVSNSGVSDVTGSNVIGAAPHAAEKRTSEISKETPVTVVVLLVVLSILLVGALCVIVFMWTKIKKLRAIRRNQVFFNSPIVKKCVDCDEHSVMMDWAAMS